MELQAKLVIPVSTGDLSAQLSRELGDAEKSPTPEKELPCYLPALMGCRSVEENYDYLNKIEEGTYGVVHRAKDKKTGQLSPLPPPPSETERQRESFSLKFFCCWPCREGICSETAKAGE